MFSEDSKFLRASVANAASPTSHAQANSPRVESPDWEMAALINNEREKLRKVQSRLEDKDNIIAEMQAVQDELYKSLDTLQKQYDQAREQCARVEDKYRRRKEKYRLNQLEYNAQSEANLSKLLKEKLEERELAYTELKQRTDDALTSKNAAYDRQQEILEEINEQNQFLKNENEGLREDIQRLYSRIPDEEETSKLRQQVHELQLIISGLRDPSASVSRREERVSHSQSMESQRELSMTECEVLAQLFMKKFGCYGFYDAKRQIDKLNEEAQTFADRATELIIKFSPPGTFHHRPGYKVIWKCLVRLVEEYIQMKPQFTADSEIIDQLLATLSLKEPTMILKAVLGLREDSQNLRELLQKL